MQQGQVNAKPTKEMIKIRAEPISMIMIKPFLGAASAA